MKKLLVACFIVVSFVVISCTQPGNATNEKNETEYEKVYVPNLPAPKGANVFSGKKFIVFDSDNEAKQEIDFSESTFTLYEFEDKLEPWMKGVYSYNESLNQIFLCATHFYSTSSEWIAVEESIKYLPAEYNKMYALAYWLDINATQAEVKDAVLTDFSEPWIYTYNIGSLLTEKGVTGYKLCVDGVYDDSSAWYKQRSGEFYGFTYSSSCNINEAFIGFSNHGIRYYDNDNMYYITSVSESTFNMITKEGVKKSQTYIKTGQKETTVITLQGSSGTNVLSWKASDHFFKF